MEMPVRPIFKGLVGGYGEVEGAPSCLLFIGDRLVPHMPECVGYVGEAAILKATRLGLATCWVAGFFKPDKAARLVHLAPSEEILAVSPGRPGARNVAR